MNQQVKNQNEQPTEYIVTVPESEEELEINIQHPKKVKKQKEKR